MQGVVPQIALFSLDPAIIALLLRQIAHNCTKLCQIAHNYAKLRIIAPNCAGAIWRNKSTIIAPNYAKLREIAADCAKLRPIAPNCREFLHCAISAQLVRGWRNLAGSHLAPRL